MLPAALCGYETSSLVLREEGGIRAFDNGNLGRIFVPKAAFTPAQHCWQPKLATNRINVDNIILQQVV
jgi:hypothetical protein